MASEEYSEYVQPWVTDDGQKVYIITILSDDWLLYLTFSAPRLFPVVYKLIRPILLYDWLLYLTFSAPLIFPVVFKLIRPILSEDTANKIRIYGCKYDIKHY